MAFLEMVNFIKEAYPARRYIVPCMVGPAGIGKTAAVKQAAAELQVKGEATGNIVTIIASQILPNEVSGITMPVAESKAMEIFDHYRLSSLKDGDILFFDELLEADQLVLSACLTLIESRELMSGHKLPDVMIVAATNPTIASDMLKENIRQRFVWREFKYDADECQEYISQLVGYSIPSEVVRNISCEGKDYNILTPRSLTKMASWITEAKNRKQAELIAYQINKIWNADLGNRLMAAWSAVECTPAKQMHRAVRVALLDSAVTHEELNKIEPGMESILYDDEIFETSSLTEIMDILQQLPEWKEIEERLSSMEIDDGINEIQF